MAKFKIKSCLCISNIVFDGTLVHNDVDRRTFVGAMQNVDTLSSSQELPAL